MFKIFGEKGDNRILPADDMNLYVQNPGYSNLENWNNIEILKMDPSTLWARDEGVDSVKKGERCYYRGTAGSLSKIKSSWGHLGSSVD